MALCLLFRRVMRGLLVSCSLAASVAWAPRADACGGFFCNNTPVIQSGEKIIFAVDAAAGTVEAIIQINYSGAASEFAWVLPLQAAPEKISVGTQRLFASVDNATAPVFRRTFESHGRCDFGGGRDVGSRPDSSAQDSGTMGAGGVDVLQRAQVGAYDSVVIQGTDGDEIRTWLVDNGYLVTDEMMQAVLPYIAQGDVLMALKLRSESTSGDLQPIAVKMRAAEACIPIRLTAIAAQEDMEVTAIVLSNDGRAVPSNYLHVTPNLTRINWLQFGANYEQLIGAAADEAGGNAFTTEYYGDSEPLRGVLYQGGEYDLDELRAQTNVSDLAQVMLNQGLQRRPEAVAIMRHHITDMMLMNAGLDPVSYWRCPSCYVDLARAIAIDAGPFVLELEERMLIPDRDAQILFDSNRHLTRLHTLLSPIEMTIDPEFDFRMGMPLVSNRHNARVIASCGANGELLGNHYEVELDDGTRYFVDRFGNPELTQLPATVMIEQLWNGTVVEDNRNRIDEMLKTTDRGESCSCDATQFPATSAASAIGIAVLLVGLAIGRRNR